MSPIPAIAVQAEKDLDLFQNGTLIANKQTDEKRADCPSVLCTISDADIAAELVLLPNSSRGRGK